MTFDMHGVCFTDEEMKIIQNIGTENEDYAICAVFENRNKTADVEYDEESRLIKVQDGSITVEQTVEMITDICESSDPVQRIGVGVSMLEVALNFRKQYNSSGP